MSNARFSLGKVVATPGALEALAATGQGAIEFLRRHVTGDGGELLGGGETGKRTVSETGGSYS